jgi:addiction module RelB/DinJ family antitoxin
MATALVQAKVDKDLKKKVEEDLKDWGLDISTAIRMLFAKIEEVGRIPFTVGEEPTTDWEKKAIEKWENSEQKTYNSEEIRKELGI